MCTGLSFATPENKYSLPSREAKKLGEKYVDRMTSSAVCKEDQPSCQVLHIYVSPSHTPTPVTALFPGAGGCLPFAVCEATGRTTAIAQLTDLICSHGSPAGTLIFMQLKETVPRHVFFSLFWEVCNGELHFLFPLQHIQIYRMRFVIIELRAEC